MLLGLNLQLDYLQSTDVVFSFSNYPKMPLDTLFKIKL